MSFRPSRVPFLHPGKAADMFVDDECVGFLGELSPAKAREHDMAGKVQISRFFWSLCLFGIARKGLSNRSPATLI